MKKSDLLQKVAYLEFVHDQLETELSYIDHLLKQVGFPRGVDSAKQVALELIENEHINTSENYENHREYNDESNGTE